MTIELNHTIVPARDKDKSARFFAGIFGLQYDGSSGHFAPVRVNDRLTLDFDQHDTQDTFEPHAGLAYGSHPWDAKNRKLNDWNGGRGVYFRDPNGHLLELLTRP
ncbi:MAG TPA: VOC family protein [Nitrospira sp.]|nr:VOC family protein [Nitrospira sp.]